MEIRKLNSIRALAAFLVMTCHYCTQSFMLDGVLGKNSTRWGGLGVLIFFILSGFLMSYLYMGRKINREEVRKFVIARVARVVPLFLFLVFFSYYVYLLGLNGVFYDITSVSGLISHLVLLKGDYVLWTIPVEIMFYGLFIFLWWLSSEKIKYSILFMAIILYASYSLGFPKYEGTLFSLDYEINGLRYFHYFFIGVIFGQLYGRWAPPERLKSGFAVMALLVIPFLHSPVCYKVFHFYHGLRGTLVAWLCLSCVFFAILFLVPDENPILSNRVGDYLGKISYSMYLLHMPVIRILIYQAREHPVVYFFIFLAVTIVISTMSYLIFEKPAREGIRSYFLTAQKSRRSPVYLSRPDIHENTWNR